MKKTLALLAVLAFVATLSVNAAETAVGSFFEKLNQKEQEITSKIEANQKAREAKLAEFEKKQAEQEKAAAARKAELEKKQAEQKAALEKAKKDAEERRSNAQKVLETEKNYWKSLVK